MPLCRRARPQLHRRAQSEICESSIVRGLAVLGDGCVVGEGNVLNAGARVSLRVRLPEGCLTF